MKRLVWSLEQKNETLEFLYVVCIMSSLNPTNSACLNIFWSQGLNLARYRAQGPLKEI